MPKVDRQKLATEVIRRIKDHPETHDQKSWLAYKKQHFEDTYYYVSDFDDIPNNIKNWGDCGATACAAGHTIAAAIELGYIRDPKLCPASIPHMASKLFGLSTLPNNLYTRYSLFDPTTTYEMVLEILQMIADVRTEDDINERVKEKRGVK